MNTQQEITLDPPDRILLIRLSAVGDIIHALPVLRLLKQHFPQAKIDWLVEDRLAYLLQNVQEINNIVEIPRRRWKQEKNFFNQCRDILNLRKIIKQTKYDCSIDLQGLTKSGLWPWLGSVPKRIGFGTKDGQEINKWLTNVHVTPTPDKKHVIDLNLSLLTPLGIEPEDVKQSIPIHKEAKNKIETCLMEKGWSENNLALLQPGAGWDTKRWPPEYYGAVANHLIQKYGMRVVVLWGPGEERLADSVLSSMKEKGELAPDTDLLELIELTRKCKLFIGGDTGPMHIAVAMGIPCITVFGESSPDRNGPYGKEHLVLVHDPEKKLKTYRTKQDYLERLKQLTPEIALPSIDVFLQFKGFNKS